MPLDPKTKHEYIRCAPSFVAGGDVAGAPGTSLYAELSLAKFLGWVAPNGEPQEKFKAAFGAQDAANEKRLKLPVGHC
jgi:hypothetical protein